jgi:outer membrane protein
MQSRWPTTSFTAVFAIAIVTVWAVTVAVAPAVAQTQLRRINVGVVVDGAGLGGSMREQLAQEVLSLTQREFDVRFLSDYTVPTDGTIESARAALQLLYQSAAVDLVIAGGPVVSHVAVTEYPDGLPKPTVAPAVLHAREQGAPLKGQSSGVTNLNYLAYPVDIVADLRVFQQVAEPSHVVFLLASPMREAIPNLDAHYLAAAASVGLTASIVDGFDDAASLLAALPQAADAVFLAQPLALSADGMQELAQGLVERGLPSFVAIGTSQVEAGLLMGLHSDADVSRVARRVALNIQRILLGESAASIPVFFQRAQRLTINARTATALGVSPSWSVLTEAKLVGAPTGDTGRKLDLVSVVREATAANLEMAAQSHAVAAGRQQVREARAHLLPQLELTATGVLLEEDLASVIQAERTVDGGASLTQALYAEPAWAAWASQKHLQRRREAELQQLRLDVAQAAATAYLNVLRAKTAERVQRQNLELTRSNLELARVRREIGISGPAEVYRWESQIATARIGVIDANAARNQAEINLNRVLHRPAEESFETQQTGLFDDDLVTHDKRFIRFLDNKAAFRVFRDYMVKDGLASTADLIGIDAAIAASERGLLSAQRSRWLPSFGLRGEVNNHFSREGAGAASPAPGGDASWNIGVSAVLPLYSGGAKFAAATRAAQELAQLQLQRQAIAEAVEARIRVALHGAGASYAGISLAEDAALAAAQNLELVEDAYGRGVVSILALLDAQNASILAAQGAANSVFDFLVDLMEVERAIGKFYCFAEADQREAWFRRANNYIDNRLEE